MMLEMTISNAQVVIAGKVLDAETAQALGNALVEMIEMPPELTRILKLKALQFGHGWEQQKERGDRTWSRQDGSFYFTNLPAGNYVIKISLPQQGTRYLSQTQAYIVSLRNDNTTLPLTMEKIRMKPTGIKGFVGDQNRRAIALAKISIVNDTAQAFSDTKGRYLFTGLEASQSGSRRIELTVSAPTYQPQSVAIDIHQGEMTVVDLALIKP